MRAARLYQLIAISIIVVCIQTATCAAEQLSLPDSVDNLELKFFQHDYATESLITRVDRLDKLVFGSRRSGSLQSRVAYLVKAAKLPKDSPPDTASQPPAPADTQAGAANQPDSHSAKLAQTKATKGSRFALRKRKAVADSTPPVAPDFARPKDLRGLSSSAADYHTPTYSSRGKVPESNFSAPYRRNNYPFTADGTCRNRHDSINQPSPERQLAPGPELENAHTDSNASPQGFSSKLRSFGRKLWDAL